MKRFLYIFIISIALFSCEREPGEFESENFIKFFGNGYESRGFDVLQISDGNFLLCGYDKRNEEDKQILIVKVDIYGNPVWSNTFGSYDLNEEARIVKEVSDGLLIAGISEQSNGSYHSFILKTSASGDSLWYKEFGDPNLSIKVNDFTVDDGFLYVAGEYKQIESGPSDYYAAVLSSEGELVAKNGGTFPNSNNALKKVFITSDGVLFIGDQGTTNRLSIVIFGKENLSNKGGFFEFGAVDHTLADAAYIDGQLYILSMNSSLSQFSKYSIADIKNESGAEWQSDISAPFFGKTFTRSGGQFILLGETVENGLTQINTYTLDESGSMLEETAFRTIPGTINDVETTMDEGIIFVGSTNATYGVNVQLLKTGKNLFILKQ